MGLRPTKHKDMRLISENAVNDSIDKWFSQQPVSGLTGCIFQLAGAAVNYSYSHKSHWLRFVSSDIPWFMQTLCCGATWQHAPILPEYWMWIFLFCSSSLWCCPCSGTETGSSLTLSLSSHSMTDTWKSHLSEISRIFSFGVTDTSVVR